VIFGRPGGGVWQGVNRITNTVASAIWVARATQRKALVFIGIDCELIKVRHGTSRRADDASYRDERGEKLNTSSDATLRRIDLTVDRLIRTHDQRPPARRPGFLEARKRLRLARVRRFRQLQ
jgi:hypothetical protein